MADAGPLGALGLDDRLDQQLRFLVAIDALKHVERRNLTTDGARRENSAEHSWHLALYAHVLAEHSPAPVDVGRVVLMALVHDIVEVDAGDTFVYDAAGRTAQLAREQAAADRLFALLPDDQARTVRDLWDEFCAAATPEAQLAQAVDRLQPIVHNFLTEGVRWRDHGVSAGQVRAVNFAVVDAVPAVGALVRRIVAHAVAVGWLPDDAPASP